MNIDRQRSTDRAEKVEFKGAVRLSDVSLKVNVFSGVTSSRPVKLKILYAGVYYQSQIFFSANKKGNNGLFEGQTCYEIDNLKKFLEGTL